MRIASRGTPLAEVIVASEGLDGLTSSLHDRLKNGVAGEKH